jgi:hypothetical protein
MGAVELAANAHEGASMRMSRKIGGVICAVVLVAAVNASGFAMPPNTSSPRISGGGWIPTTVVGDGKGTFGMSVRGIGTDVSGTITYHDKLNDITVKSTALTSVTPPSDPFPCAMILGTATVNGQPDVALRVSACDTQEHGRIGDAFEISVGDEDEPLYEALGPLGGGNIQVHGMEVPQ